jgi:HEAT repeat protein
MLDRVLQTLIASNNAAADEVLLEALRLGNPRERAIALHALIQRKSDLGLAGVVGQFEALPAEHRAIVLAHAKVFYHALRECGRSDDASQRLAAMSIITQSHQGKLAYVLSENLHDSNETFSKAAAEAMVGLARWASEATRELQRQGQGERGQGQEGGASGDGSLSSSGSSPLAPDPLSLAPDTYAQLCEQRPEIEEAIARAMDVHRGRHGQELLRAGLMLADWAGSKTLAILNRAKHGGQSPMVRKLQQAPPAELVEAFLLGASHGGLRSHFGVVFSHINEAPVLDAILRKTHWLKDHQLQICMHHVSRGTWWADAELLHDIERRPPQDAARIAEWIAASGAHDVVQDERMKTLLVRMTDDFDARLRLLRIALRRRRGSSVELVRAFLTDSDERLVRIAAREIVRRRPTDFENILLQLMTTAPDSVRRVISRSIGQVGFDHFWMRFDRLDKATRKSAGRAMMKLLPDAVQRLGRRLSGGPIEQRLKAMQIAQDLDLGEGLVSHLMPLCQHPHPKVRSKAVAILSELHSVPPQVVLEKALHDTDPRVRANAIEVLEAKRSEEFVPLLVQRARSGHSRERANAIKAMSRMKVATASTQLLAMLRDERPEHKISALWTLRQIGLWQLLAEVGRLAKEDQNLRVRRYALGVLRNVAESVRADGAAPPPPPQQKAG